MIEKNNKIKNIYFILIVFIVYISLFFPIWNHGQLYYDDWSVAETGLLSKNLTNVFFNYLDGFITRPFGALLLAIISQFEYNYKLIFFLNLILWFSFSAITSFVFSKIFFKKFGIYLFFLLLFPNFCITNIISPHAQSLGTASLLLWSISFYFTFIFIQKKEKKIFYFLLSIIFFTISCLTYEISFPLILLNLSLKYLKENKQNIKINIKSILNFKKEIIIFFLISLLIFFYQKIIVGYMDFYVSNRYRIEFNYNFLNTLLNHIHIPFKLILNSISIFLKTFFYIDKIFFYFLFVCVIVFIFNKKIFLIEKNKLNNQIFIIIFLFYILFLIFFIIAYSIPTIYGYYNRAMGAYNLFFLLLLLSISIHLNKIYFNNKNYLTIIILFINFLTFFNQIHLHADAAAKRTSIAKSIINKVNIYEKNLYIFGLVPTFNINNFNGEYIFSEEVVDFSRTLNYFSKNKVAGTRIYKHKNCNEVLNYKNNSFYLKTPSLSRKSNEPEIKIVKFKEKIDYYIYNHENKIIKKILRLENLKDELINVNLCNELN